MHVPRLRLAALLLLLALLPLRQANAQDAPTVCTIGVNVEDLYDLDMARDTFGAVLWLWSVCPSDALAPLGSITFPTASGGLSLGPIEAETQADGQEYASRRVQGTFRFNWDMNDYPFDRQRLTIPIDESGYGAARLTFEPDHQGSFVSPGVRERLDEWAVSDLELSASVTEDPSTFGLPDPEWSRYARLEAAIPLERANLVNFLKLTSGVFAGVFIAFLSFFYDPNDRSGFGGKLGLLVGVLFAVLLSLRGADASLGDAGHLTLVTAIHLVTLAFIVLLAIVALRDRRRVERGMTVRHPDWPMLAAVGGLYVLIVGAMVIRAAAS
jgi:hypothetical protein